MSIHNKTNKTYFSFLFYLFYWYSKPTREQGNVKGHGLVIFARPIIQEHEQRRAARCTHKCMQQEAWREETTALACTARRAAALLSLNYNASRLLSLLVR